MAEVLTGLEPALVFRYFEELTQIPRGSGNERAVSEYLVGFAHARGYAVWQDGAYNVKICVPSTPGEEGRRSVALQAHMDMVCAKECDRVFDFETQPIEVYVEDGFIRARGTTLGADDGIGVALILAVLDSADVPHPPLEAIFTAGEETMMAGARAMDACWIESERLIGLDYSDAQSILVSCAGISLLRCALPAGRTPISAPEYHRVVTVEMDGLLGGHSAKAIHLGRANAIQLLGELMDCVAAERPCRLLSLTGGTLVNVIPARAKAELCCEPDAEAALLCALARHADAVRAAYRRAKPGLRLQWSVRPAAAADCPPDLRAAERLLDFLRLAPSGVHSMADDDRTRAESSANLGVLEEEDGVMVATFSVRSNLEYQHDALLRKLETAARLCGLTSELVSRCACWEYRPESALLDAVRQAHRALRGREAQLCQIHAGVEGGAFLEKAAACGRPLELVNIGCTTLEVHTGRERLEIASVGETYRLLRELLRTV